MLGSKKFEKTILLLTVIVLVFSLVTVCFPNIFSWISRDNVIEDYSIMIFGKDIINIEITADEARWNEMIENKMAKQYISCDIKIDGKEFSNVGLRPKGNASLTNIQVENRIGFRLDFDHYIANQKCYGLEQMVLNNLQADATYMKDFIAYDLMEHEGVKAPLHTFANITLNGEPFGVYLAVEVYDKDYLTRAFNDTSVKLYNVKSSGLGTYENALVDPDTGVVLKSYGIERAMGMGGPGGPPPGGGPGGPPPPPPGGGMGGPPPWGEMGDMPPQGGEWPQGDPSQNADWQQNAPGMPMGNEGGRMGRDFQGGPPPPPGGEGGGGDLVYTDDSTSSYRNIFANAVSDKTTAKDYARVIRAIKYLNKENVSVEELEKYWDIDAILRYLAVHVFMVNGDSYTGNMNQNYYLAEQNGKVTVLPWDYNLSFGAFGGGPGGPPGGPGGPGGRGGEFGGPENFGAPNSSNETIEVINHDIDNPMLGVTMESRPLVSVLLGIDEYKNRYHQYLNELSEYASNDFITRLEIVNNAIRPYIEMETVAFYTVEDHDNGFEALKKFLRLRCWSIQEQVNGRIPSEAEVQNLIAADYFSVNDMGSMGPGPGGHGGPGGGPPGPPPGMPGGNEFGGPPPGMPPGPPPGGMPPGMMQNRNNSNYIAIVIALAILCIAFIGVKKFKRNY